MAGLPEGIRHYPGYYDAAQQGRLVDAIRAVVKEAPLYIPRMPRSGKPMQVRMSNCGTLGWVTDKAHGYRYQATHPETGRSWPAIPPMLEQLWRDVSAYDLPAEACLINFYADKAKMGLHQDRDEADFG